MGSLQSLFAGKARIVMVGFEGAGKTTVIHKLKLGEVTYVSPSFGFHVESVETKALSMSAWDLGGGPEDRTRHLRHAAYENTGGIIFVVDASDVKRMSPDPEGPGLPGGTAGEELQRMLNDDRLKDAALLVLANKQDLPGALKVKKVAERLGLSHLHNRNWHVQGTCALKSDGLREGIEWLVAAIDKRHHALTWPRGHWHGSK